MTVEREPLFEQLGEEAAEARKRLLEAVDTRPGEWWDPAELRAAAGVSGAMAMYALSRLCNPEYDDTLELDSHLRVRRRGSDFGRSARGSRGRKGLTMSRDDTITVWHLWGRSEQFDRPQLVAAFSDGLVDAMVEEHEARREEAIGWFLSWGDDPRSAWTFWETCERVPTPAVPAAASDEKQGTPRD